MAVAGTDNQGCDLQLLLLLSGLLDRLRIITWPGVRCIYRVVPILAENSSIWWWDEREGHQGVVGCIKHYERKQTIATVTCRQIISDGNDYDRPTSVRPSLLATRPMWKMIFWRGGFWYSMVCSTVAQWYPIQTLDSIVYWHHACLLETAPVPDGCDNCLMT